MTLKFVVLFLPKHCLRQIVTSSFHDSTRWWHETWIYAYLTFAEIYKILLEERVNAFVKY